MTDTTTTTPDAAPGNWVTTMPRAWQPYLRLARADRPIGTWLLFIPCLWGLGFAFAQGAGGTPTNLVQLIYFGVLFAIGSLVMRGAGCAYNDIVDRDIDAKVARTALRPIPAGEVSLKRAWVFLVSLCLTGLLVLVQFNSFTIMVGLASLALVAAYPFMKRITYWPQAWLGLTFNWGVLVGYASLAQTISPGILLLYGAGIFWTLGYDTIYAHQDTEDDALIGVKSTALKFGAASHRWLTGFYAMTIAGFAAAGWVAGFSISYFLLLFPAALHFAMQVRKLDIGDAHNCLRLFKSNRNAGLLLLGAPLCEGVTRLI